jgi:hypothetical protein
MIECHSRDHSAKVFSKQQLSNLKFAAFFAKQKAQSISASRNGWSRRETKSFCAVRRTAELLFKKLA